MKKLLICALVATLLAGMFASCAFAAGDGCMYVKTENGKGLNLREEPNKTANVILKIPYGDEFWVFEMLGNGWAYGHWGGQFGYVMSRYLSSTKPSAKPADTSKNKDKEAQELKAEQQKLNKELKSEKEVEPFYIAIRPTRSTGWVNFRVGPSKITSRITTFGQGKELIAVGTTTNWYRAKDPETNKVGYIHKNYATKLNKAVDKAQESADGAMKLGQLTVNGEFDLTCKLPADYKLQVVNAKGEKIVASVLSDDMTKPQMYLSIAYDEMYGEVERMNDMSAEELAVLEESFIEMNQVEISYRETGLGTKLLVARETGSDTDFVDILAIYKGYLVEFNMTPNPKAASQTLTEEQVQMCIDFLTNVDFNPIQK